MTARVAALVTVSVASVAHAAGPANGLYVMSVHIIYDGGSLLEAYYFKDGLVARSPIGALAQFDFATERKRAPSQVGEISVDGAHMTINWADGSTDQSDVETRPGDPCFDWNDGIFCPVAGFPDGAKLAATFAAPIGNGGTAVSGVRAVTFALDGSYRLSGADPVIGQNGAVGTTVAGAGMEQGTYRLAGTDLQLTPIGRTPYDVLAFPYNRNDNAPLKPDSIYFDGVLLDRQ
jgi:hypothetical protein